MASHNCTVLNWNVRGLNNPARRQVVRDLISHHRASVISLQETKLQFIDRSIVLETLGPDFADSFCYLPAVGTRGGILLGFSSHLFDILNTSVSTNTISASVSMRESAASWSITAVYGPQSDSDKAAFIEEIKGIKSAMLPSWMLLGDFNLICKAEDKSNSSINRRLMNAFKSALNALEVFGASSPWTAFHLGQQLHSTNQDKN